MIVILYRPEIPQNTGNIVRTCAVTKTDLILVKPLGFSTSSRMLKRSGLDYWDEVKITQIEDLSTFLEKSSSSFYFFSSKATKNYTEIQYSSDSILIFGSETKGLPDSFKARWENNFVTIPMKPSSRCLNVSNCVSIAIYEALRQQNFNFPSS